MTDSDIDNETASSFGRIDETEGSETNTDHNFTSHTVSVFGLDHLWVRVFRVSFEIIKNIQLL